MVRVLGLPQGLTQIIDEEQEQENEKESNHDF